VEYTSIPLIIALGLTFISGYGLVKARLVRELTFGLIQFPESMFLHTNQYLVYLVGLLIILHSFSGLGLLIIRKIRYNTLEVVLESINIALIGATPMILLTAFVFL
jgi:hypothetical protein